MTALKVLWLSPWMRPLARIHSEALAALGHEVLLVTSDQHPESDTARSYELVLTPRVKVASTWPEFARARRQVARFAPDVVVAELVRDPRWPLLARGVPVVHVGHDDRPHDASEQRPRWERRYFDRWARSAAATVTFSRFVAAALEPGRAAPIEVVPLTSDLSAALVPSPASAADRRDFVVFGRLNAYKNLGVTFAAWRRHTAGPAWRGDELVLVGDGVLPEPLPPHARWVRGTFSYADVIPILARAKGSLVHYRQASQSGVQVVSMQLGVTPIVSPQGALPEFQPEGEEPIGIDDVAALTAAIDGLADPAPAARRGAAAQAHYLARFSPETVASRWQDVLVRAASPPTRTLRPGPSGSTPPPGRRTTH